MKLTAEKIAEILEQARAIAGWDACCDEITFEELRDDMAMIDHLVSQLTEAIEYSNFELRLIEL